MSLPLFISMGKLKIATVAKTVTKAALKIKFFIN